MSKSKLKLSNYLTVKKTNHSREWLFLFLIILIAAIFRLYNLDQIPPCLQFDEAFNATDAARVLAGERPIFLPANGGREVLYTYYQAIIARFVGLTPYALRLSSAIIGILTIPLAYFFVRSLSLYTDGVSCTGRNLHCVTRLTPYTTALFVAISYWHLHFSRYGIRSITLPLLITAMLYAYWRGVTTRRYVYFLLSGVILGISAYSHPAVRLWPFILIIFTGYLVWADRAATWHYLAGLAITGIISAVIFLPLGRYFWQHQEQFFGHASAVSVFAPRVSGGNALTAMFTNAVKVAGMFFGRGDAAWIHNLPGRPVMSWLAAPFFLWGVYLLIRQAFDRAARRRHAAVLLFIWLGVALIPSVLSDDAPNFSRTIGAIPAAFVPLGLAADWLVGQVSISAVSDTKRNGGYGKPPYAVWVMSMVIVGIIAFEGVTTWRDYFQRFAAAPELYYRYGCDMRDVAEYLNRATAHNHVYLAPLWAEEGTIEFLTRDYPIKSFESSDTIVLPTDKSRGAVYAFPWEQEWHIERFAAALGEVARYEVVQGANGQSLMHTFHIAAEDLPTAQDMLEKNYPTAPQMVQRVNFGDELELLGYTLAGPTFAGRGTHVTIYWRGLREMVTNYTVFVHAVDDKGRIWGQQDRWHANGTYPTSAWAVGDIVIDAYYPLFDPCTPPGEYKIVIGLYDQNQRRVPLADSLLTAVELGEVRVDRANKLRRQDIAPRNLAELELDSARLVGYDVFAAQAYAGGNLPINLYWQITADEPVTEVVRLELSPNYGANVAFAPPLKGEYVCNHYDIPLPRDLPAGAYQLSLQNAQTIVLGEIEIVAAAHDFTAPNPQRAMFARVGENVEFVGYDLATSTETITLTLYWHAVGTMETSYTVFAHLLDETGQVRGQHDSPPVHNTRPTNQWVVGEYIADPHIITMPADAVGIYQPEIGMYDAQTGQRLPVFDANGARVSGDRILLGQVVVE